MRTSFAVRCCAVALMASSPALAQTAGTVTTQASAPTPAPTAAEKEAARERYKKGVKLFDLAEQKKDPETYEQAYAEFAQAFAVWPDDKVLWNLALSELETKRLVQALRHLREYDQRRHVLAGPKSAERTALAKYIDDASRATGHIDVTSTPGARITLDGKEIGRAPLSEPLDVVPGSHVLVASNTSGTKETRVTATAGETSRVALAIDEPATAVPPPPPGPTPEVTSGVVPAEKPMEATSSGLSTQRKVALVVGGVAVASFAAGVIFGLKSSSDSDRAASFRSSLGASGCIVPTNTGCSDWADARDSQDTNHALSIGFYIGAGAAGAAAVALWFLDPKRGASHTAIAPLMLPSGGGLQLRGEL